MKGWRLVENISQYYQLGVLEYLEMQKLKHPERQS